jgi:hypothetical protein
VQCCSLDTLFLKRFLSDGDSIHHKHRSSGSGELMVLMMMGTSGVRRYLQQQFVHTAGWGRVAARGGRPSVDEELIGLTRPAHVTLCRKEAREGGSTIKPKACTVVFVVDVVRVRAECDERSAGKQRHQDDASCSARGRER